MGDGQDVHFEAGVYSSIDKAKQAVHGLLQAGFRPAQITVICSDQTKEQHFREFEHEQPAGSQTAEAALKGGTIGGALGGFTAIASAPAFAGLALWIAGPIAAVIGAGAVLGGLVGAMMTRGVEKELANYYQQAVVEGRILVAAEHAGPGHQAAMSRAAQVLGEAGAEPLPLREG